MSVAALVLAAGRGERLGHDLSKAFVPLAGKPVLLYALEAMAAMQEIDCILPVVAASDFGHYRRVASALRAGPKLAEPVAGGAERQASVRAGLEALPRDASLVAIHDAARPLVRAAAVARVVAAARREGAAILAFPVPDTLKIVRGGRVVATPERAECYAAQTPQVFRVELLREALAKADAEGRLASDDAQLVEWLGAPVAIVEGDPDNLKLTHPEDFAVAERWLAARKGQPA
jgi:2-C-methyl-D-erythritol 4-phosphate cytidylyltransferase